MPAWEVIGLVIIGLALVLGIGALIGRLTKR